MPGEIRMETFHNELQSDTVGLPTRSKIILLNKNICQSVELSILPRQQISHEEFSDYSQQSVRAVHAEISSKGQFLMDF